MCAVLCEFLSQCDSLHTNRKASGVERCFSMGVSNFLRTQNSISSTKHHLEKTKKNWGTKKIWGAPSEIRGGGGGGAPAPPPPSPHSYSTADVTLDELHMHIEGIRIWLLYRNRVRACSRNKVCN